MRRDLLLLLALKDDTELRKANQQNTKENSTAHTLMRKKKTCCRICCRGKKHPKNHGFQETAIKEERFQAVCQQQQQWQKNESTD